MSKKQQKEIERRLLELVNDRNNDNKCGECSATYPTWASYNLGIFLCGRCASIHKQVLGSDETSKVLSLTLDQWSMSQVEKLARGGNKRNRKKYNSKKIPFPYDGDDDKEQVAKYFREKYIDLAFTEEGRSRLSSNVETRSRLDSYGYRSLQRSDLPKLTHRKLTTFESTQYKSQVNTILGYGHSNKDSILESLLLSGGNIETAMDILELDAKINPSGSEIAPELPTRRPRTSESQKPQPQSLASAPLASAPQLGDDWWSNQSGVSSQTTGLSVPNQQTGVAGQPQIYQYTDPITGRVSYIDDNGQEYLDPNNPEHQQLLAQQTNPQFLQQQHTKQNILSLYGQNTQQQPQQTQQPQLSQPTGLLQPQMSIQSQQLLQQSQFPPQQTGNGFGLPNGINPQATGFGFGTQATGYQQYQQSQQQFPPQNQQFQQYQQFQR